MWHRFYGAENVNFRSRSTRFSSVYFYPPLSLRAGGVGLGLGGGGGGGLVAPAGLCSYEPWY
jgi:hypothetical protein